MRLPRRRLTLWTAAALLAASALAAQRPTAAPRGSVLTVDTGRVTVPRGVLFYEVAGHGAPVVLLHPAFVDRRLWDAQFVQLAARYRVYRYDARGYGRSTPATQPFSRADDLARFLDGVGLRQATLVGASLGGGTALDFAVAHPERVARLVLVGSSLSGYTWPPEDLTAPWHVAARAALARGDTAGVARAWLLSEYGTVVRMQPLARERLERLLVANVDYWKGLLRHGDQEQEPAVAALPRLTAVRAPTLVVVGDQDAPDIQAIADTLLRRLPNARRVVLPGAGHFPSLEHPARFTRELLAFLAAP